MKDSIIILIGNICELENNRIVSYNEGFKFAEEKNLIFLETSAKDNIRINDIFILSTKKIIEKADILLKK